MQREEDGNVAMKYTDKNSEMDVKSELAKSNIHFSGKTRIRANRQSTFIMK